MIVCPATAVGGPLFTIEMSALCVTTALAVELLFAAFGSLVDELTVAVFESVPLALGAMANVDVMVTELPAGSVANEHGNVVVHAPLFDTNVIPADGVSFTVTPLASDGPAFDTVMLYVAF